MHISVAPFSTTYWGKLIMIKIMHLIFYNTNSPTFSCIFQLFIGLSSTCFCYNILYYSVNLIPASLVVHQSVGDKVGNTWGKWLYPGFWKLGIFLLCFDCLAARKERADVFSLLKWRDPRQGPCSILSGNSVNGLTERWFFVYWLNITEECCTW